MRRRRLIAEINVVPYIDVMLVLLVIFMITVPLLQQGVEVDLPRADAETLTPPDERRTLILNIDAQGKYYLHFAGDSPEQIDADTAGVRAAAILSRDPQTPVLVRADSNIAYGVVIQAMVLLQQAGASKVGLSTQTPEP